MFQDLNKYELAIPEFGAALAFLAPDSNNKSQLGSGQGVLADERNSISHIIECYFILHDYGDAPKYLERMMSRQPNRATAYFDYANFLTKYKQDYT